MHLNNSFSCLNNITRIFTYFFTNTYFHILFYQHVFPKNTNNVTRTTLPNGPWVFLGGVPPWFHPCMLHWLSDVVGLCWNGRLRGGSVHINWMSVLGLV